MAKEGISVVLTPRGALAYNNAFNLNPAVLVELKVLLPTAELTPTLLDAALCS